MMKKPDKNIILQELQNDYNIMQNLFPKCDIIGVFAFGSMNKGTWYQNSDVDFICLINSPEPTNYSSWLLDTKIYYYLYDINTYLNNLYSAQGIVWPALEPLFTEYFILNPKYITVFQELRDNNEQFIKNAKNPLAHGICRGINGIIQKVPQLIKDNDLYTINKQHY
jgi:hypothetical protein